MFMEAYNLCIVVISTVFLLQTDRLSSGFGQQDNRMVSCPRHNVLICVDHIDSLDTSQGSL